LEGRKIGGGLGESADTAKHISSWGGKGEKEGKGRTKSGKIRHGEGKNLVPTGQEKKTNGKGRVARERHTSSTLGRGFQKGKKN